MTASVADITGPVTHAKSITDTANPVADAVGAGSSSEF